MIVTDPDDLREIHKGNPVEVQQKGETPAVDSVHPIQTSGLRVSCHVIVRDAWPHQAGGYVALVVKTVKVRPHVPNLLRAGGGYTSDPGKTTHVGAEPEPESVPKGWTDPGARARVNQQEALNDALWERLSLPAQLQGLLAEARASRIDVRNRLAKIAREVELLERDLRQVA